jgi:N-methylhydantoinase B
VVELDTRRAAPLRAWARLDPSIRAGTLPIDQRGLAILKAVSGDLIEVRRLAPAMPTHGPAPGGKMMA